MRPLSDNAILIIANPCAGRKRSTYQQLISMVRTQLGSNIHFEKTKYIGHAEQLAYQASKDSVQTVVAVGGDGTIHEILNGLLKNPENQTALCCLPAGTANDYAATLMQVSASNFPGMKVDVGLMQWDAGRRYFANVAGVGLPGSVADRARRMKRLPARLRYTTSLLYQMGFQFGPQRFTFRFDDGPNVESFSLSLSAAIGRQEGSYPLHPDANIDDGLFEVLRLGRLHRREIARHFPAMLRGRIPESHTQIEHKRCSRIEVSSELPIPIHLDGEEPICSTTAPLHRFTLEVIPSALICNCFRS